MISNDGLQSLSQRMVSISDYKQWISTNVEIVVGPSSDARTDASTAGPKRAGLSQHSHSCATPAAENVNTAETVSNKLSQTMVLNNGFSKWHKLISKSIYRINSFTSWSHQVAPEQMASNNVRNKWSQRLVAK